MEDELFRLLAAREGHFQFESGHHGNLWLDLCQLLVHAGPVRRLAAALSGQLAAYGITAVCGPLLGGALVAQNVAAELDLEFYHAERTLSARRKGLFPVQYRIPDSLRARVRGRRVAVVDDVINAGSAVRATADDVTACGGEPVVIAALLVLGAAAPRYFSGRGLPVQSIARLESGLWTPEECPLCEGSTPLEVMGASS